MQIIKKLEITAETIDGQKVTVFYDRDEAEKISVDPGSSNNATIIGVLIEEIVPLKDKLEAGDWELERIGEN